MCNSGCLQKVLRFLLFKMENQVVLIPGEFYIFATFFFLHLALERERKTEDLLTFSSSCVFPAATDPTCVA